MFLVTINTPQRKTPTTPVKPAPIDKSGHRLRIEAVVPCVNYADFLAEMLPRNLAHFDHIVVVTSFDDKATQELCRRLSVDCQCTDEWFKHGDQMNMGAGVAFGAAFCRQNGFLCRMDADIYLPAQTRNWIEWSRPDPDCIYGIDRVNCIGWQPWQDYIKRQQPDTQHLHHYLVCPPHQEYPAWPLGARLAIQQHGGYIPIGFFQMWHTSHGRRYPWKSSGSAEHTDVQHAMQWPAHNRRLLPEVIAVHLESEACPFGTNWNGRKTKPFGPPQTCPPPPKPYGKVTA